MNTRRLSNLSSTVGKALGRARKHGPRLGGVLSNTSGRALGRGVFFRPRGLSVFAMVLSLMSGALVWYWIPVSAKDKKDKEKKDRFAGPISSQPLALTADGESLLVVNPDNNSVTIFAVK